MHHENLTITDRFEITGRGTVFTTKCSESEWVKDVPYNTDDTFMHEGILYKIRGVELKRTSAGYSSHVGLQVSVVV